MTVAADELAQDVACLVEEVRRLQARWEEHTGPFRVCSHCLTISINETRAERDELGLALDESRSHNRTMAAERDAAIRRAERAAVALEVIANLGDDRGLRDVVTRARRALAEVDDVGKTAAIAACDPLPTPSHAVGPSDGGDPSAGEGAARER